MRKTFILFIIIIFYSCSPVLYDKTGIADKDKTADDYDYNLLLESELIKASKDDSFIKKLESEVNINEKIFMTSIIGSIQGDVNDDGIINLIDAILIVKFCINSLGEQYFNENNADVNLDGNISIKDAVMIVKFYFGEIDSFPENLLQNSSFNSGSDNWYYYSTVPGGASLDTSDNSAKIIITDSGEYIWDVGLGSTNTISVENNSLYRLIFKAKASTPYNIKAQFQLNQPPWDIYSQTFFDLTTEFKTYQADLLILNTDPAAGFLFQLGGGENAEIIIDDIILKKISDSGLQGEIVNTSINAPSLSDSIFPNNSDQPLCIYLPPSYSSSNKQYPVVLYLHGYSASEKDLYYYISAIDGKMSSGEINEFIIAAVNGNTQQGGGFYVNSPVSGNWEDFIINDTLNYLENNYRIIKDRKSRGIFGHSMGGFGALNIALRNPDIFSVVYSMSGAYFYEDSNLTALSQALTDWYNTMPELIPNYGAAFAFNNNGSYDIIDQNMINNLDPDDEIVQKWNNGFGNLTYKIENYKYKNIALTAIGIDVGDNDEYQWITGGNVYLSNLLNQYNINNDFQVYNGRHFDKMVYRVEDVVLKYFSDNLIF